MRVLFLTWMLLLIAPLYAGGAADTRCWLETGVIKSFKDCMDFELQWGERWRNDCRHPHYTYGEIGLYLQVGCGWELQPVYRQIYRLQDMKWKADNNPRFSVIKHWDLQRIRLSNRSRLDYRDLSHNFFFRNRFKAIFRQRFLPFNLIPFAATECFLKKGCNLTQVRFEGGFLREVEKSNRRRDIKLSYMHRLRDDSGTWHGYHTFLFTFLVAM